MKPLKCYVIAAWCLWNGHVPVAGTAYSVAYGKRIACTCCEHCRKVL